MPEKSLTHPDATPAATTRLLLLGWILAFAASLALYTATADRGAQWQDSGTHIQRILTGQLANPLGLALSHPLHYWLGRLAAGLHTENPAFSITLVSSVAAAISIANLFGIVGGLTKSLAAAAFAAASLALAHTFWHMATITETYTLVTASLSGEIWCALAFVRSRRPLYLWLAFALNGLGFANHNAALLTTPILAAVLLTYTTRRSLPWPHVLACAALWLVASLPYTALIASDLIRADDRLSVLRSALFGHAYAEEVLNVSFSLRRMLVSVCFILLNFPNLALPLAAVGAVAARGLPFAERRILYAAFLVHFLFVIRYPVIDQHTFFLPSYLLIGVFAGLAFAQLTGRSSATNRLLTAATVLLLATPLIYVFVPGAARRFDVLARYARNKPFRDDYAYLFTPWGVADASAERLGKRALEAAGENALIIVPDTMAAPAVWYEAYMHRRKQVEVVGQIDPDQAAQALYAGRRVLLVPLRTDRQPDPIPVGSWKREGDFFLLQPASVPGGTT